jgi:hypothetical protein
VSARAASVRADHWPVTGHAALWGRALGRALLIAEFTVISTYHVVIAVTTWHGIDARIYHRAVVAWLSGGNPWEASFMGASFAAPPPTLLYLAPFAPLPEDSFVALSVALGVVAAVFTVRRLGLPLWWVLFPPLVESIAVGNPNVVVLALLVAGGTRAGSLAIIAKVYAAVPLAVLGRWRPLLLACAVIGATVPVLPWGQFLAANTSSVLMAQSAGGKSAAALPWLVPFVLVGLVLLGRQRAAWLVVPALWPATQSHYAALALPALSPVMAAVAALPLPMAAPAAVLIGGAVAVGRYVNRIQSQAPSPLVLVFCCRTNRTTDPTVKPGFVLPTKVHRAPPNE